MFINCVTQVNGGLKQLESPCPDIMFVVIYLCIIRVSTKCKSSIIGEYDFKLSKTKCPSLSWFLERLSPSTVYNYLKHVEYHHRCAHGGATGGTGANKLYLYKYIKPVILLAFIHYKFWFNWLKNVLLQLRRYGEYHLTIWACHCEC